ncbi:MAG: P-loop domain-containing protein, partial [Verrucomicrobiota bacterium]
AVPRAMEAESARAFSSPPSLEVTLDQPHSGPIQGMGIPEGVTLIVGGGFHGKSTLLQALELGMYHHRSGDGREKVVTRSSAVKIRAEDGRSISSVDISSFISNLPEGSDTRVFSTQNASGSTSQAANIVEAMEVGSEVLLIDEDTAATNFMIRDQRMQRLISPDKEPITPFVSKVRALYEELGISSVLVIGGSGDYFDVADHVIAMDHYEPKDLTKEAKAIAGDDDRESPPLAPGFPAPRDRFPEAESLDPSKGKREASVKSRDRHAVEFGRETIDLSAVSQLVHRSQTRAIGAALLLLWKQGMLNGERSMADLVEEVDALAIDDLSPGFPGDFVRFRKHELASALNRLRTLRMRSQEEH